MGAARLAIAEADAAVVAAALRSGGYGSIEIGGFTFEPGDLLVETEDKPGIAAASEGALLVGIDTTVTPELEAEGTAREFVHRIQNMRKAAGFEIEERIVTYVIPAECGNLAPSPYGEGRGMLGGLGVPLSGPLSLQGERVGVRGARPPLPTRGEGWGEGTGRGEAGTVDVRANLKPPLSRQPSPHRRRTSARRH